MFMLCVNILKIPTYGNAVFTELCQLGRIIDFFLDPELFTELDFSNIAP